MAVAARIFGSLGLLLTLGLLPAAATAQDQPAAPTPSMVNRVRSGDARLTALITEAATRSATFKTLLGAIEATDGIVFVEYGRCPRGVPGCLTWQVTVAGPYRLLFVLLDPRRSDLDLMASAGHELRHALEVLDDPSLNSTAAIHLFYRSSMSPESPRTVETRAAMDAGDAVFREVRRSRSAEQK